MQHNATASRRPIVIWIAALIAICSIGLLLKFAFRSPSNAQDASFALGRYLTDNDVHGIQAHLWSPEQEALGMSPSQTAAVLKDVLCPAFQRLDVKFELVQQFGGGYDWYGMAPAGPVNAKTQFYFGLLQMEQGRFYTTLTYLYLGLQKAEEAVAHKLNKEPEYRANRLKRNIVLARLGMPGLFDARDRSVAKW